MSEQKSKSEKGTLRSAFTRIINFTAFPMSKGVKKTSGGGKQREIGDSERYRIGSIDLR